MTKEREAALRHWELSLQLDYLTTWYPSQAMIDSWAEIDATRAVLQQAEEALAKSREQNFAHQKALGRFLITVSPTGFDDMKAEDAFELALECVVADREQEQRLAQVTEVARELLAALSEAVKAVMYVSGPSHALALEISDLIPRAQALLGPEPKAEQIPE